MADQERAWSAGDLRDAIRAMDQDARVQAQYMATERPYSTGPVARHPVWSDELRAESGRLRDEGLLASYHPWETDPVAWPSADPMRQADLVANQHERDTWEALATEIGDTPDDDMSFKNTQGLPFILPERDTRYEVSPEHIMTVMDVMQTYGHHGYDTIGADRTQGQALGAVIQDRSAQHALASADELRQFFAERTRAREPEGMER